MLSLNYSFGQAKKLFFAGVNHSNTNLNQIKILKELIHNHHPDLILVEGGFENADFLNEEEAISTGGELGFTSYFAKKQNITIIGNDPHEIKSINFLKNIYGKDFAFVYFILRNFSFFVSMKKIKSDEKGLDFTLEDFKNCSHWNEYDISKNNFFRIFKSIFGIDFFFQENYSNYTTSQSKYEKFKKATNKLSLFRDFYMFQTILKYLENYDRIFIVKGESHLEIFKKHFETFFL